MLAEAPVDVSGFVGADAQQGSQVLIEFAVGQIEQFGQDRNIVLTNLDA